MIEKTVKKTGAKSANQFRAQTLVLGGTGKTGRRVADRLVALGVPTRIASRSGETRFDWTDPTTWARSLAGVHSVYLTYAPDLAIPGATEAIRNFVDQAVASGVGRLVLLSGRGEEEAQLCEEIVQRSGVEWTIVRSSWFSQNFSEGEFLDMVMAGQIVLPAGQVGEPFIDVEDIADVAVAALTEAGHVGEIYEVTGPRLLTFGDAIAEINRLVEHEVQYVQIPHEAFADGLAQAGLPEDIVWLLSYLFATVLDGRNAHVCDGVERALGRKPTDFSDFVRREYEAGAWNTDLTMAREA